MRFPNAFKGVKKIFTAEILSLLSVVAMLVSAVLSVIVQASLTDDLTPGTAAVALTLLITAVASAVFAIVGGIILVVGVIQASKDEGAFKISLVAVILGLIATGIYAAFSASTNVQSISQSVIQICHLVTNIFVIQGIINLSLKLDNEKVCVKGKKILNLITVIYILIFIAYLFISIIGGSMASLIAGIISIVAAVLAIINYFLYLSYLSTAKKMLSE